MHKPLDAEPATERRHAPIRSVHIIFIRLRSGRTSRGQFSFLSHNLDALTIAQINQFYEMLHGLLITATLCGTASLILI